jgi:hypothetical protein
LALLFSSFNAVLKEGYSVLHQCRYRAQLILSDLIEIWSGTTLNRCDAPWQFLSVCVIGTDLLIFEVLKCHFKMRLDIFKLL